MRQILINSDVSAESAALLLAHAQNVQTHSIIITDSATFLHYGEKVETDSSRFAIRLFNDVNIIYTPDLVNAGDITGFTNAINAVLDFVETSTLQPAENAVIYIGSTIIDENLLKAYVSRIEGTYIKLVCYKSAEKFTDQLVWHDADDAETEKREVDYQYTILYNKKFMKQAQALKRDIILITEKDVLDILEATRQDKFIKTNTIVDKVVTICAKQLDAPEKSVSAWLAQNA